MIDIFDVMAFVVFAVLLVVAVVIVVLLGQLPGRIAHQRGHLQAAAITVCGWLGLATLGLLWPVALIWVFLKPLSAAPSGAAAGCDSRPAADSDARLTAMQSQVDLLEATLRELQAKKEVRP